MRILACARANCALNGFRDPVPAGTLAAVDTDADLQASDREVLIQEIVTLRRALESRDVIGQAKGILMERFLIDADAAFALLQRTSQQTNTKLHDLAGQLASTGKLPEA